MNVAIYLRKSREEIDETREETLKRHENILFDYCSRNNLNIVKTYREIVSGESIEKRPQMQLLLDDVKNKLYDGVVVVELERLSRGNQIDQAEILEIFKKSKTKIYTLNKVYDLSSEDEFDEEFFEFGLFMSRREYKVIRRRLLRGKKQAQKEGFFISPTLPFGYDKEKQGKGYVLIPNEKDSKIVKMIFDKYVHQNQSILEIRNFLNDNNINHKSKAEKWTTQRVRRILSNKTYIGYIVAEIKTDNPIFYKGNHISIVDDETFNLAQEKLKIKLVKTKRGANLQNPLASLLHCSFCGKLLHRNIAGKNPETKYSCRTVGCPNVQEYCYIVENKVISELQSELKDFNYFLNNYENEMKSKQVTIKNEIAIIESEILKKENMINKACEMLEEGIYTKEKYLSRVNILEQDLNALKSNLRALNNINYDETERYKTAIPILEKVLDVYWDLKPKDKNDLLKSIIEKIEYTKTERNSKGNINPDLVDLKIYLKI